MQEKHFYENLSSADFNELADIFQGLTPESLHSDGETDNATAASRYDNLQVRLQATAKRLNVPAESISENSVFDEILRRRKKAKAVRP